MADTKKGREDQADTKEAQQREHELEEELAYEDAAEKRKKDHEDEALEEELGEDE
ncbi:hypothetical protein [Haloarchaeobius sp. HME9146]|uniref:hypothetical protein n=1 Tax=Haloarchaeobius sp. HME9146 TaxID=2978732 RepID=UPI0021BEE1FF|nr:hypothetical protein [Haloarchaeobius sp. HME9146]MCT9098116.1 hypothetical protein [Haloarchaeobius sp. HME9146]